jgi:hypothetical protein
VWSDQSQSTFRRNTLPLSSWSNSKPSKKLARSRQPLRTACFILVPCFTYYLTENSKRCYESYSVLPTICTVATVVNAMWKYCGRVVGCDSSSSHWQLNCMNKFNVLIWVIFLLKVLANIYWDSNKEINNIPSEEQWLVHICHYIKTTNYCYVNTGVVNALKKTRISLNGIVILNYKTIGPHNGSITWMLLKPKF